MTDTQKKGADDDGAVWAGSTAGRRSVSHPAGLGLLSTGFPVVR
jgi:hypothetical protein